MYSYVGPDVKISSSGTNGDGGKVIVWADKNLIYSGHTKAEGGASGKGGLVETSGKVFTINGAASVKGGLSPGEWLLDPNNITIASAGPFNNMSAGPNFTSTDDSATLDVTSITTALDAGGDVTVSTASLGANLQDGDITIAADIITTAGGALGNVTLRLNADGSIINNGVQRTIESTSGKLNVIFNSDRQASGSGRIQFEGAGLGAEAIIKTKGGNITFGGGANPTTGYAEKAGNNGVNLSRTKLDAGGGDIIINGKGDGGKAGIFIVAGSIITTNGSGNITIKGDTNAGDNSAGIVLDFTTIETVDGDIILTGLVGLGNTNYAISENMSSIQATGAGNIKITGICALGDVENNFAVRIRNTISTQDGNIEITGSAGLGATTKNNNNGVYINGLVEAKNNGNIVVTGTAGGLGYNYAVDVRWIKAKYGDITLNGTSNGIGQGNVGVFISGTYESLAASSKSITMNGIYSGGSATGGTATGWGANLGVLIDAPTTFSTIDANLNIIGSSNGTGNEDHGIWFVDYDPSSLTATGTASINLTGESAAASAIVIPYQNTITTNTGNITLYADTTGTGSGGIQILGSWSGTEAVLQTSGGDIILGGGADPTTGNAIGKGVNVHGVELSYTKLLANGGDVIINGRGLSDVGSNRYGVSINESQITTSGYGAITLDGNGGTSANNNFGIQVIKSTLETVDGDITIDGIASSNLGTNNHGINIDNATVQTTNGNIVVLGVGSGLKGFGMNMTDTVIKSTNKGDISLTVTGSSENSNVNDGLDVDNSSITTYDGNLMINATGGTGSITGKFASGIYFWDAAIESQNKGTITLNSTVQGGDNNFAMSFYGNTTVKSNNGNIYISATNNATGQGNFGIDIASPALIQSTGTATITMNGTYAGAGAGGGGAYSENTGIILYMGSAPGISTINGAVTLTGSSNGTNAATDHGIEIVDNSSIVSTGSATITLDGTATNGFGIATYTGANVIGDASNTGDITLRADKMSLADLTLTNTGNIYLQQKTTAATMDIATAATSHIIAATVFSGMTTSSNLYIGNSNTGALTVSSAYSYKRPVIFDTNGANITISAAQSTVAASNGSLEFMDPVLLTADLDVSNSATSYDYIKFNESLTLPTAGITRNLTTNTGTIYLADVAANNNTLAYPGTGLLSLGGTFTSSKDLSFSREIILHGKSDIDNGTRDINITNDIDLGIFDLRLGTGGNLNLSANINSISGSLDLQKDLVTTQATKFTMGRGNVTIGREINSSDDLEFSGTGKLYLGEDITLTSGALTFGIPTYLTDAIEIDTGSGDILFSKTLDNDYNIILKTTGDLTFKENVGYQDILGYVTVYNAAVDIQKGFRSRGLEIINGQDFKSKFDPAVEVEDYFRYTGTGNIDGGITLKRHPIYDATNIIDIQTSGYLKAVLKSRNFNLKSSNYSRILNNPSIYFTIDTRNNLIMFDFNNPNQMNLFSNILPKEDFSTILIIDRLNNIGINKLTSTEKEFGINPYKVPFGIIKNHSISKKVKNKQSSESESKSEEG
jgi:hypothetical protein